MDKEYRRETLLTTVAELQSKLGSPNLCIIDVRAAEDYAKGHIPGATHFDLFGLSLVDTSDAPLKAFMHMIHHVLELRGVSETREVVFYENNSGMRAARGVWFLEYYGHPNVRMLDGGFQAWRAAGAPWTTDATPPKAAAFNIAERRDVLATADDVLRSLRKSASVILDTRSAGEYHGTHVRATRGGAIPGAVPDASARCILAVVRPRCPAVWRYGPIRSPTSAEGCGAAPGTQASAGAGAAGAPGRASAAS